MSQIESQNQPNDPARLCRKDSEPDVGSMLKNQILHHTSAWSLKRTDLGEDGKFRGYLSVFGNTDWYGEVMMPGCFTETIAEWKKSDEIMPLLWQHNPYEPIGVWTDFKEDKTGLWAEGQILVDAGPLERRAWAHIRAGSLTGLSPGYYLEEFDINEESMLLEILKVDLREGSVVTFPANREARIDNEKAMSVSVRRKLKSGLPLTVREVEHVVRDELGLSRRSATAIIDGGYRDLVKRDAPDLVDDLSGWDAAPEPLNLNF